MKILVTHGSERGGTAKLAGRVAATLRERGHAAPRRSLRRSFREAGVTRTTAAALAALTCVVALAACAPGANPAAHIAVAGEQLAGFWLGLWHGVIIWVTFVWSIFDRSVSIYEVHNDGWPYDLGFAIGAAVLHGGGTAASRRRWRVPTVVVVQPAHATDADGAPRAKDV